jgi:hypothetical protein
MGSARPKDDGLAGLAANFGSAPLAGLGIGGPVSAASFRKRSIEGAGGGGMMNSSFDDGESSVTSMDTDRGAMAMGRIKQFFTLAGMGLAPPAPGLGHGSANTTTAERIAAIQAAADAAVGAAMAGAHDCQEALEAYNRARAECHAHLSGAVAMFQSASNSFQCYLYVVD